MSKKSRNAMKAVCTAIHFLAIAHPTSISIIDMHHSIETGKDDDDDQ